MSICILTTRSGKTFVARGPGLKSRDNALRQLRRYARKNGIEMPRSNVKVLTSIKDKR